MTETIVGACVSLSVLALVLGWLEHCYPARRQNFFRPEWLTDVCFFLGQYFAFGALTALVLAHVDAWFGAPALSGLRPWSAELPLVLRAALALALGDLCIYWFHRACHHFEFLWRFHAVHHSSLHLDWLAAYREHPLDGVCTVLLLNLPAIAIGLPFEALGGLIAFRGAWAIFIHSNTRIPLGPLRVLFGAPELHHFHHARVARTAHNFANLAPWLDVVFGTYHHPAAGERYELGLTGIWPRGYVAQLLLPLGLSVPWSWTGFGRRITTWSRGAQSAFASAGPASAAASVPASAPAPQGVGGPASIATGSCEGSTH